MQRRRARGAHTLSAMWLQDVGAPQNRRDTVTRDVLARLEGLPSVLGLVVRPVERGLAMVPEAAIGPLCRLPGLSEYARLVESLTAVAYFDLVEPTSQERVPQQRTAGVPARAEQV